MVAPVVAAAIAGALGSVASAALAPDPIAPVGAAPPGGSSINTNPGISPQPLTPANGMQDPIWQALASIGGGTTPLPSGNTPPQQAAPIQGPPQKPGDPNQSNQQQQPPGPGAAGQAFANAAPYLQALLPLLLQGPQRTAYTPAPVAGGAPGGLVAGLQLPQTAPNIGQLLSSFPRI